MSRTLSIQSFILILSLFTAMLYPILAARAASSLEGQTIAVDAGHDSVTIGTTGWCGDVPVPEYEVNEAVRTELVGLLAAAGATGYEVEQLPTRKERVMDAEENSSSSVLISIHHNGSSNTNADYTQFFVTQKNDKDLANAIYPIMVNALGGIGKGIKSDGYGMTVYGSLPGVLTESYFITNTNRACEFLNRATLETDIVELEARALFDGLEAYFTAQESTGGGGKPDNGGGGKGRNK